MTSSEMMKKIGLSEDRTAGGKNNGKLKSRILKYLKDGKNKLLLLENRVKSGKNYKKLKDTVNRSEKKLEQAKQAYGKYEKKAEKYIEKNPKKAVAMAAAAGILAGSLWAAFHGKEPAAKKKK